MNRLPWYMRRLCGGYAPPNHPFLRVLSKKDFANWSEPPWKQLQEVNDSGDKLAYRWYIRCSNDVETVQNCIARDHGLPNFH